MTIFGFGINVNDGSTLNREWITLNVDSCPVLLANVGIKTARSNNSFSFTSNGQVTAKEPIVAYEIHHVLYDVFGDHLKTLSNVTVTDFSEGLDLSKRTNNWYATQYQVSEYLFAVSYVANVRTKTGTIWRCDFKQIKEQLNKLKISFEENYIPKKDSEKQKK